MEKNEKTSKKKGTKNRKIKKHLIFFEREIEKKSSRISL